MRYPLAANLPFNSRAIESCFVRGVPGAPIPEGRPWYAVVTANSLVVEDVQKNYSLLRTLPDSWGVTVSNSLFLGSWFGEPLYAVRIGKDSTLEPLLFAEPFNAVEERLDDSLLTIGGLSQQVLYWDSISRRCAKCGGEMAYLVGTWGKRCLSCSHERYPAVHPCAIVLIRRGDEFLLIRKPEWGEGRYSLVAGFLDFGESLEECAVREVKEETGVDITNVQYVGSQCWPFPSQLMAGFVADYAGGEVVPDVAEIADARWFTRQTLPVSFPPYRSIARWIIERYALNHL
ncbi:NAD(+) diphosphatase [Geobacter pelophilus]|uniref:NAD(+) diphosphatase n=1 Tax=Geoanaerobacter pelophilus TaxID=60036 RepID=A0AAW4KWF0_9BACT|nr:NAD(+) diphosphatase [Geoanaerobacter pelophilus]MBT0662893.1 NAD(+) diphosphatase [Geoanaerobacter pelophilus]